MYPPWYPRGTAGNTDRIDQKGVGNCFIPPAAAIKHALEPR
ncbi:hypothetical protein KNP414_03096 [Paenibacillus mucilaginosus KNP414]|uniref:Uncharacterized protein n=1 Tax=Paenibacillus mucilaginosus (strain KNP414) TaxID=1036673 RepID=F8FB11_PAEMK|nr:hypothetical protein KNP414_03096 [Paenibacillus mucilaginosus KNP414]